MLSSKEKILEYHENLVNQIDIQTEEVLLKLSKNKQNKENIQVVNSLRELFIKKVKEIEKFNLESDDFKGKFCFLIPNEKKSVRKNDTSLNLCFRNEIGVLIIVNETLSPKLLERLKIIVNEENSSYISDSDFDTLENLTRAQLIVDLLKEKFDNPIIDLTKKEENKRESFEIESGYNFYMRDDVNFNFLDNYIDLEKIEELKISNDIKLPVSASVYRPFRNIKKLSLSCYMEFLEEENFIYLEKLEELNIGFTKMYSIDRGVFDGLDNLKRLNIEDTPLYDICTSAFRGIDGLEILNLNSNKIEELRKGAFKNLKNLRKLELNHNLVKKLMSGCFIGLENLQSLGLNRNFVHMKVNKRVFVELVNLEVLDLGNNQIKNFDPSQFAQMKKLKFFNFRENLYPNFEFINNFEQLEFLDLSTSRRVKNLDQINLENIKFLVVKADKCFKLGPNFKSLQGLEFRNVTGFEKDCFENLQNLDYLSIQLKDEKFYKKITADDFDHVKNLKVFTISVFKEEKTSSLTQKRFEQKRQIFEKLFDSEQNVVDRFYADAGYNEENLDEFNDSFESFFGPSTKFYYYLYQMKNCESEKKYFDEILQVSPITREALTKSYYAESDFAHFGPRREISNSE